MTVLRGKQASERAHQKARKNYPPAILAVSSLDNPPRTLIVNAQMSVPSLLTRRAWSAVVTADLAWSMLLAQSSMLVHGQVRILRSRHGWQAFGRLFLRLLGLGVSIAGSDMVGASILMMSSGHNLIRNEDSRGEVVFRTRRYRELAPWSINS